MLSTKLPKIKPSKMAFARLPKILLANKTMSDKKIVMREEIIIIFVSLHRQYGSFRFENKLKSEITYKIPSEKIVEKAIMIINGIVKAEVSKIPVITKIKKTIDVITANRVVKKLHIFVLYIYLLSPLLLN